MMSKRRYRMFDVVRLICLTRIDRHFPLEIPEENDENAGLEILLDHRMFVISLACMRE